MSFLPGNVMGRFVRQLKTRYKRCLAPGPICRQAVVSAHSIQNSRILDILCQSGHVVMLHSRVDANSGMTVEWTQVGRNQATTFTGLCAEHDAKLFSTVDNGVLPPQETRSKFLMAYRSVLKELHTKNLVAVMTNNAWHDAFHEGRASDQVSDPLFLDAVLRIGEAYNFYRYKIELDRTFLEERWDELEHEEIVFQGTGPRLAVSSVYSTTNNMATLTRRLDPQCLVLNVFPVDADTHIIFSFKARQRSAILDHLHPLLIAHGSYQRYLLSRFILTHCENFVLSLEAYTSLPPDARDVIRDHFFRTIRDPEAGLDDPRLMLFGAT